MYRLPYDDADRFDQLTLVELSLAASREDSADPEVCLDCAVAAVEIGARAGVPADAYTRTVGLGGVLVHPLDYPEEAGVDMEEVWDGIVPLTVDDDQARTVVVVLFFDLPAGAAGEAVGCVSVDVVADQPYGPARHLRALAAVCFDGEVARRVGDWTCLEMTGRDMSGLADDPSTVIEELAEVRRRTVVQGQRAAPTAARPQDEA